jgi:hypothetical protein
MEKKHRANAGRAEEGEAKDSDNQLFGYKDGIHFTPTKYAIWKVARRLAREDRLAAGKSIKDIENDDFDTYIEEVEGGKKRNR